ncbi:MAG TPA: HAD-IA family hydrolase [Longimicrobiaceae bacterium]|nr:HAD-IA family hydrolase [Longimicrobiaceae bacterium]
MSITHVFFDIGGVLGTNGWDHVERAAAQERFGLSDEFEHRHQEVVGDWEMGLVSLDEYLGITVFYEDRDFSRDEFVGFMEAQSQPFPESLEVVRGLRQNGGLELMTLNNEAEELNSYRIERFGLCELFDAFLSSCWLGARKPSQRIFHRALGIVQAPPGDILFIDDRAQNLAPARALGMATLHFTGLDSLTEGLREHHLM